MLATLVYLASVIAGLLALGIAIVAVLVGAIGAVLAVPGSAPLQLPARPTALAGAALGLLLFIAAATFLASVIGSV